MHRRIDGRCRLGVIFRGCSCRRRPDAIAQLVGKEDATKPLSDQEIVALLKEKGIPIARRTVAKYRESLRIPSSVERRREKMSRLKR